MAKKPKITRTPVKGRYKSKTDLAPIPKPGDPGWVSYKFNFTTTPRPDTQGLRDKIAETQNYSDYPSFSSLVTPYPSGADVVRALESLGNKVIALLDVIGDARQRKALKKFVSDFYTDEVNRSNSRVQNNILVAPLLKNTEEA